MVQSHTQILCQNLLAWALLVTVGSAQPIFSGGSVSRCVPFWRTRSERDLSALSPNQYIAFWGVRVKLIRWDDQLCVCAGAEAVGCHVPSCGGSSYPRPSSLDSAACPNQIHPQWSNRTAEGLRVTSCSDSVLFLDMWSIWHGLMALGGVKIYFSCL